MQKSDPIAGIDQAGASLRTIAPAAVQFFRALRKEGLDPFEAAVIVAAWLNDASSRGSMIKGKEE